MRLEEKIDKYMNEDKKFPKIFGKKWEWKKSKNNKGYYTTRIPTKDGDWELEIEWSPEDPENAGWAEVKGKKVGNSGMDSIEQIEYDFEDEVKLLNEAKKSKKYPELRKIVDEMTKSVAKDINKKVKNVDSEMPYKSQWVLEELIKNLQELV